MASIDKAGKIEIVLVDRALMERASGNVLVEWNTHVRNSVDVVTLEVVHFSASRIRFSKVIGPGDKFRLVISPVAEALHSAEFVVRNTVPVAAETSDMIHEAIGHGDLQVSSSVVVVYSEPEPCSNNVMIATMELEF